MSRAPQRSALEEAQSSEHNSEQGGLILIADDNPLNRQIAALADKDELAPSLESGMNESMVKPFNRSHLVTRVLFYVA